MTCNCENERCQLHEPAKCAEVAFVRCLYIGGVCLDCAYGLQPYLLAITDRVIPAGSPY